MSIQITKRALSAGFGAGALALLAERASADTPFLSFAFPVTGGTTRRTMPDRLADIVNVKDYGAAGNGTTDDTAAVRAAIDAAAAKGTNRVNLSRNGATVFFPPGQYLIREKLTLPSAIARSQVNLVGAGKTCCALLGAVANDYLIESFDWNRWFGLIDGFTIYNNYGIFIDLAFNLVIQNCAFHCGINALNLGGTSGNVYNTTVYNCTCAGGVVDGVMTPGSVGIYSAQCEFYNISVTNYDIGFAGWNTGIVIQGSRFEVNNTAIVLGQAPPGGVDQLSAFNINAISFERNDTTVYLKNCGAGQLSGLAITGTVAPYFGLNNSGNDASIASITWNAGIASITTTVPHGIANFLTTVRGAGVNTCGINVYGTSIGGYNGNFVATVTGPSTLTFPLAANPGGTSSGGHFRLQPSTGIRVGGALSVVFSGVNPGGSFSNAAIDLSAPNLNSWFNVFTGCIADHHNGAGGQDWKMPLQPTQGSTTFVGCNNPPVVLTFNQLPGQPGIIRGAVEGMEFDIRDGSSSRAFGAVVSGGGSDHCKVRYNGTNWTLMGK